MEKMKINEAVSFARQSRQIKKKDLARIIWPNSTPHSAMVNLCNLTSGKSKSIQIDSVPLLCKELGVTADFLFGLDEEPTRFKSVEAKRKKLFDHLTSMVDSVEDMKDVIMTL